MEFALEVFAFCRTLPQTDEAHDIVRQLRRSSASVAANCRATRRTGSDRAFAAKASIVIEEADESGFWLDFLVRARIVPERRAASARAEANELVAIFTASRKTVTARIKARKKERAPKRKAD